MTSRRERAAAEREKQKAATADKSCQSKHPIYGGKCWMSKPCEPGTRHMVVRPKAGGGVEKFYWPAYTSEERE